MGPGTIPFDNGRGGGSINITWTNTASGTGHTEITLLFTADPQNARTFPLSIAGTAPCSVTTTITTISSPVGSSCLSTTATTTCPEPSACTVSAACAAWAAPAPWEPEFVQQCYAASEFPGAGTIDAAFQAQGANTFCRYANTELNPTTRTEVTYQTQDSSGVPYFYGVYWNPGCANEAGGQNPAAPLGPGTENDCPMTLIED